MSGGARALTGPAAAALLGLDGYRDLDWPIEWCAPIGSRSRPGVVRTRHWAEPLLVGELCVAPVAVVVRHLATTPLVEGIEPIDRIELAVEHALRDGAARARDLWARGGSAAGDRLLRTVLRRRRDEPPTESYAETRALQFLRRAGIDPWRQVQVIVGGRVLHRADFVVPDRPGRRRPEVLGPDDGVIVEIDGREFHERQFEQDHRRQTTYDRLGFRWLSFTPNQIEATPGEVLAAVERRRRR